MPSKQRRPCDEGRQYVDNIVRAGERMGPLIDDLPGYARLGRWKADERLQQISFGVYSATYTMP